MSMTGTVLIRADADGLHTRRLEPILGRAARIGIRGGTPLNWGPRGVGKEKRGERSALRLGLLLLHLADMIT